MATVLGYDGSGRQQALVLNGFMATVYGVSPRGPTFWSWTSMIGGDF